MLLAAAGFLIVPVLIASAPLEPVMGVVQKIFYFHVPCVLVSGPLWGRKAWGVYWQWDARLTSSLLLFLMLIAYLLARKYGGPGGRRLSAALALFAAVNVPLVYKSVDIWRTIHPRTTVVPSLDPAMRPAFWSAFALISLIFGILLTVRMRLEAARAALGELRLEADDLLEAQR